MKIRRQKGVGRLRRAQSSHSPWQIAAFGRASVSPRLPTACRLLHTERPAFTLIEMMVVIAVILLGMTLAIPAIRSLTGSRSVEAAENTLSSYVNFVRTEAIGLQRTEGVMFFLDTSADRIKCAAVMDSGPGPVSGVVYLDLVPDHDPFYLPSGIRAWTMKDIPPLRRFGPAYTDPFLNARYLGFNPNINPNAPTMVGYGLSSSPGQQLLTIPGGVILFDKTGHLIVTQYGLRLSGGSQMSQLLYPTAVTTPLPLKDWPPAPSQEYLASQIGLVLFDRESFLAQTDGSGNQFTDANDSTGGVTETMMENWFNQNTTPVFVNRYDGTLMRAE